MLRSLARTLLTTALLVSSATACAAGWEGSFFVLQTDAGRLVELRYASTAEDEARGRRVWASATEDKSRLTRCSHEDTEEARKLSCTVIDGKSVRRTYLEKPAQKATAAQAESLFRRFVGDRLASSVGFPQDDVFVCVAGCPAKRVAPVMIFVDCGECGMEEEECERRQDAKPTTAVVRWEDAEVRDSPSVTAAVIARLMQDQPMQIMDRASACAEFQTSGGVRVGRWIKVLSSVWGNEVEGWVFDADVRYAEEN
jgi:hypothetical protein